MTAPCDVPPKVETATHLPRRSSAVLTAAVETSSSVRITALTASPLTGASVVCEVMKDEVPPKPMSS